MNPSQSPLQKSRTLAKGFHLSAKRIAHTMAATTARPTAINVIDLADADTSRGRAEDHIKEITAETSPGEKQEHSNDHRHRHQIGGTFHGGGAENLVKGCQTMVSLLCPRNPFPNGR